MQPNPHFDTYFKIVYSEINTQFLHITFIWMRSKHFPNANILRQCKPQNYTGKNIYSKAFSLVQTWNNKLSNIISTLNKIQIIGNYLKKIKASPTKKLLKLEKILYFVISKDLFIIDASIHNLDFSNFFIEKLQVIFLDG